MKNFRILLALMLIGCMIFGLCACGGGNDTEDTTKADTTDATTTEADTTKAEAAFKVIVVDGDGNAVPGTMVQVCKDSCVFAEADENGVAPFNVTIEEGHKLSVLACPEGYEYTGEAEIYLEAGITEYTLEISKVG